MRNEVTVKTSASLSYYAGALRVARADYARIENSAADYPADIYGEVLEAAKGELFVAEEEFRCEFQACQVLEELAAMEAAPVAAKPRCAHWKAIKRVYAIAREKGLDTSKAGKARMRNAMENTLGRCVNSRGEYTGADWMKFGDWVKSDAARW